MEYWKTWLEKFYEKVKGEKIFKNIPKKSDKVAVIIEPRKHPLLKYVLYNFIYFLAPKGWAFQIFHGTDNKSFVEDCIKDLEGVHMTGLPFNNIIEPTYNILLTNSGFYKSIVNDPTHILIFQTDCLLFTGELERFLKYDMIGAKWAEKPHNGCNGGLSMRNREAMIRICENYPWVYGNEDVFFTLLYGNHLFIPSEQIKDLFSIETVYSENSAGTHKLYEHHPDKVQGLLEKKWKQIFREEYSL